MKVKSLSRVRLLAIPWTAAYQAPPSLGFSRQEYWSGLPLPSLIHILEYDNYRQLKVFLLYNCIFSVKHAIISSNVILVLVKLIVILFQHVYSKSILCDLSDKSRQQFIDTLSIVNNNCIFIVCVSQALLVYITPQ